MYCIRQLTNEDQELAKKFLKFATPAASTSGSAGPKTSSV